MILFDKIKDELADKLEDENPSSQYDVQEKARRILSWDMIDDERFEPIKDWAYKKVKTSIKSYALVVFHFEITILRNIRR